MTASLNPFLFITVVGLCLLAGAAASPAPEWKAGLAAVCITPKKSLWMAGFAARKRASEGVLQDLYVKALALEDEKGRRAVVVTADLLGFPGGVAKRIAERVREKHRIPRERLVLNASHTHGGPVIGDTLRVGYQDMTEAQWSDARDYTREVEDRVVECVAAALKDLRPATLRFGRGRAGFAGNRRLRLNPDGPVDHDVPVLRVDGEQGELRAVLFGYACHNTTLVADVYRFHGDYAGFAQEWLQRRHPGSAALFVCGCGADVNPTPRGKLEMVQQYGEELGKAVDEVLGRSLQPLSGPLRCAYEEVSVKFAPFPDRAGWEAKLNDRDVYVQRHAREMLAILERKGKIWTDYAYPVQVWQLGKDLTWVHLAGEVVVDYALRLKKELGGERTWVSGYSNDVFAYIPSERVLREGGYEGGEAMIYYNQPGPFAPGVEETIVSTVHKLVRRTR